MDTMHSTPPLAARKRSRWYRDVATARLAECEIYDTPGVSLSRIASQLEVPRTTLRYWRRRKRNLDGDPEVVQFLESPAGLAWVHRLVGAVHLIFGQADSCGIRNLCLFFRLSGLDQVVASSYGSQQKVAGELESLLVEFGRQQEQQLKADMDAKQITVCQDETFHPEICLVAIEPTSNYLLLEQYAEARDTATWNHAMQEALDGVPVEVIQCTGDQAKALVAHAQQSLGAHHSPDVFHVQQELSRATSFSLAQQTRMTRQQVQQTERQLDDLHQQLQACQRQCPQSEHVQELRKSVGQTERALVDAQAEYQACQERQSEAAEARRTISHDYHPFDLATGQPCDEKEISQRLSRHFDQLEQLAFQAQLFPRCQQKLAKARRVLPKMVATIAFFWSLVCWRLRSYQLAAEIKTVVLEQLIPGFYLQRVAEKAATAPQRHELSARSEELLQHARDPTSPLADLSSQQRGQLEGCAQQCAELFQRSSSCVEGRNGQLSLRHHALHRLSSRKLACLRVLHNYFVRRADGTTAAERFFGQAPHDLFDWILDRLSLPPRPAARRAG